MQDYDKDRRAEIIHDFTQAARVQRCKKVMEWFFGSIVVIVSLLIAMHIRII